MQETPSELPSCSQETNNSSAKKQGAAKEETERGTWTGRFDFLVSLMGYSVGLQNAWRFPYLCYSNGGGVFLIPFTSMLIVAGLPLMFMELSIGQFVSFGPVIAYRELCPLLKGLGYGMVLISFVVMLYYNLILGWTFYYIYISAFRLKGLPWLACQLPWSMDNCLTTEVPGVCSYQNMTDLKATCANITEVFSMDMIMSNITNPIRGIPAEKYFIHDVLELSSGIEKTGSIVPQMAMCLLMAWIIVFLCLFRGVKSSGKVAYFTAFLPYIILVILFIRGITLPGAKEGILFYLMPNWSRLMTPKVWADAAVQVFFALSPAWGGLITLSSYNKFDNNCYRDSLIVAATNVITSFFSGLVMFSMIGFLAHELKVPIESVVDQGAGLAFIVYPAAVARLPFAPVWSLLFFAMLLTLGLDSEFALMETVTTAILDAFPALRSYKMWVVLITSIVGYIGGLIFTTNSGMYWLQLVDKYATNWSVLLIAISECILVSWIYGVNRFLKDVQMMIGPQTRLWKCFWRCMWKVVTPATLFFILFFNWMEYQSFQYRGYVYPKWANCLGWFIGVVPLLVIVGVALYQLRDRDRFINEDVEVEQGNIDSTISLRHKEMKERSCKNVWLRARMLLQPTSGWRPRNKDVSFPLQEIVCTSSPEPVCTPSPELVCTPSPEPVCTPSPEPVCTPSPEPVRTPSPGVSGYNPMGDTIIVITCEVTRSSRTSGTTPKLPGPSILKKPNRSDLCISQQV